MAVGDVLAQMTKQMAALQRQVSDLERAHTRAPLHAGAAKINTIASGAITVTRPWVQLLPETGTTDTLNSIAGGSDGKMIVVALARDGDAITINPYSLAAGNIDLAGSAVPLLLDDEHAALMFILNEATGHWELVSRSDSGTSSVETFLELVDTPDAYTGEASKAVQVKADESGLEFVDPVDTFLELTDTPALYTGQSGKVVAVNLAENALEFVDPVDAGSGDGAGVLFVSTPDTVLTFSDSEVLYTIPAGTISQDGQSLWYELFITTDNSDTRTITVSLDAQQVGFYYVEGDDNEIMVHGRIIRTGATAARSGGQASAFLQNEVVSAGRYLTSAPVWADPLDFTVAVSGAGAPGPTTTIRAVVIGRNDNDTEDFLGLSDTPNAYTGEANKLVAVKADESGLEFVAAPAGALAKYAADFTVAASVVITHNLGTVDVIVQVRDTFGDDAVVYPEVQFTDANNVTLLYDVAIGDTHRVVVIG